MLNKLVALALLCLLRPGATSPATSKPGPAHELLSLLPLNKIGEIEATHLATDDGFKAAVLYLQSAEWKRLVDAVTVAPEFDAFAQMALRFGVNLTQAMTCLRAHIDQMAVVGAKEVTAKPNLEPFIADVQNAVQIQQMLKALARQAENPATKKLMEEVGVAENQKVAENLHGLKEMAKVREVLRGMNFDVEPYIALMYTLLGWVH